MVDPVKTCRHPALQIVSGQRPTGLAFDAGHHPLFSATGNRKLVVLNSDTGEFFAAPSDRLERRRRRLRFRAAARLTANGLAA